MSQPDTAQQQTEILREVRELGRGLNEVKVSIAKLEGGQEAMRDRLLAFERQSEQMARTVQEFDRFRSGAGVKLGTAQWVGALLFTLVISGVVSMVVSSLKREPERAPAPASERRHDP